MGALRYSRRPTTLTPLVRFIPLVILVLASGPTKAQQRAGITEHIDFLAVADNGQPITGLAPSEVTFKLDGRPRAIRSLQFVELASQTPGDRRVSLGAPLAAPYGSNRLDDLGRIVMIAMDRESIRPGRERPARDAALRFLATLSPRDRVGLGTLPRVEVEPTSDHEQIREALMRMTGLSPQERTASEAACRSRLILNTLTGILQSMAAVDGPKTIAFISTGIVPPTRDAPLTGPPGQCEITTVDYDQVATAASLARAHFYVIQPDDEGIDSAKNAFADPSASRFRSADDNLAGLQNLAGVTGGELYRLNAGQAEAVFTRVARESSAYYVIAFEPEPGERNGQPHRVEIKVARERVTVRTRPFFTIAKGYAVAGDITPQRMLREARQFRDLPLRATAYASGGDPGDSRLKVIAAAEPMDPTVSLVSAAVGLFDAKGKLAAQWSAEKEELASLPLMSALPVPPGPYRLRVAAVDSTGRRGTVDYLFQVGLESAGALKLSGMALGTLRGGFQPKLQFGSDPAAVGYFEIYGTLPSSAEVTVRFEVAEIEDGPALSSSPGRLQATSDDARRIAIGSVPIATLSPGDYVVRAVLNVDGRTVGAVRRTLRKTG